jgi:hypothetical protein
MESVEKKHSPNRPRAHFPLCAVIETFQTRENLSKDRSKTKALQNEADIHELLDGGPALRAHHGILPQQQMQKLMVR